MLTTATLLALLQILGVNLLLSGDNALVIAMVCRELPTAQRVIASWGGAIGAVIIRIALIWGLSWMLDIPGVKLLGGLALIWIAWRLVKDNGDETDHRAHETLLGALGMILVADLTMSGDNVIALAAIAHGNFSLLFVGLLMSIPIILFGASFFLWLLNRFWWVVYAGAGLLVFVAWETIKEDAIGGTLLGVAGTILNHL